jgi:hypothetical protein
MDNNEELLNNDVGISEIINNELQINSDTGILTNDIQKNREDDSVYHLPLGRALNINETYSITAKESTRIIVLVGPSACGKTTIETMFYQMFHKGAVGDYYFSGSNTIQAFENRSFYTRTRSRRTEAMTPRTNRGTQDFLHLRTWNYKFDRFQNYLFADLSGEEIVGYIGNTQAILENYSYFSVADYIVAILDGEMIIDKRKQKGAFEQIAQLLQTIYDSGVITKRTTLQLVISKYDIVDKKIEEFTPYINRRVLELESRLKKYIEKVYFYYVAAMPTTKEKFGMGYGLEKLMLSWCSQVYTPNIITNNKITVSSEFDKLQEKLLGDG